MKKLDKKFLITYIVYLKKIYSAISLSSKNSLERSAHLLAKGHWWGRTVYNKAFKGHGYCRWERMAMGNGTPETQPCDPKLNPGS